MLRLSLVKRKLQKKDKALKTLKGSKPISQSKSIVIFENGTIHEEGPRARKVPIEKIRTIILGAIPIKQQQLKIL